MHKWNLSASDRYMQFYILNFNQMRIFCIFRHITTWFKITQPHGRVYNQNLICGKLQDNKMNV